MCFIKYIAYENVVPFFFNGRILVVLKHTDITPDCKWMTFSCHASVTIHSNPLAYMQSAFEILLIWDTKIYNFFNLRTSFCLYEFLPLANQSTFWCLLLAVTISWIFLNVQSIVVSVSSLCRSSSVAMCCIVLISLFTFNTILTVLITFHQLHLEEFFMYVYICIFHTALVMQPLLMHNLVTKTVI
jgi:hypothetical protein